MPNPRFTELTTDHGPRTKKHFSLKANFGRLPAFGVIETYANRISQQPAW
jgi:hypothetical protein